MEQQYTEQQIIDLTEADLVALRIKLRVRASRCAYQADCKDTNGKRRQPTAKTRLEVLKKALKLMGATVVEDERRALENSAKDIIAYPADSLIMGYKRACEVKWTSEQRTAERTRKEALEIVDAFGRATSYKKISKKTAENYILQLKEKGFSNATINRRLTKLRVILNACADNVEDNYYRAAVPVLSEPAGRERWFTVKEEKAIISWFYRNDLVDFAEFVQCSVDTGARCGELFGLSWASVNLDDATITFSTYKNEKRGSGLKVNRIIPLLSRSVAILRARKERGLFAPFANITHDMLSSYWKRMRDDLGYSDDKEFVPHVLRHTCASRLLMSGETLESIAQWLGHACLATTQRYAKMHPIALQKAKVKLESYAGL